MTALAERPAQTEVARIALGRSDLLRDRTLIDGAWISTDETVTVRNPATGGLLAEVPRCGTAEAERAVAAAYAAFPQWRSEEHTSELQSLMRISYAVFCLKKKKHRHTEKTQYTTQIQ